ncbi:MAG: hypothetical protein IPH20_25690 [Bacteroidales bacterium]|nr:hypothetical protein [Bacteroidales bacterium]
MIYTVVDASNSNSTNSYSAATTANGTTLKNPVSVPYTQDFESSTTEWTLSTAGINLWAIGSATNNGGSKGLYISNDNGVTNAYTITVAQTGTDASFRVNLSGLTAASLTFDWKANGEVNYDYGEVYINTGAGDVRISGTKEFNSTTAFANRRISLSPYVGGNVTIKFRWVNDASTGTAPPFAVDNVTVADGDVATLTTTTVSSISVNGAVTGGEITNGGGSSITARGVVYGTSANPTLANSFTSDGTGTGTFTSNLTGLDDNTMYYVRAYATNSTGTAYGNEFSFTTSSVSVPTAYTASATGATVFYSQLECCKWCREL